MLRRLSTLQIALLISIAVHGALLTLRMASPATFDRLFDDTPLEVILVNAKTHDTPAVAQAIAQASLAGGGDADSGRATSPLPASRLAETGDSSDESHKQIQALQEQQEQLLAQIRKDVAALPPPDLSHDAGNPRERDNEERRRQLLQLIAEIEKRIIEESSRPKKRFISPATREEPDALYYNGMRLKIEEVGTRNFPESEGKKLYGELFMNITVDDKGRVVDAQVARPSRSRLLNNRAVAIVRAAGPFAAVTPEMRARGGDLFVFTARFTFSREHGFDAALSAPPSGGRP